MLNRKQYFIREHVGLLKLTDVYDILDPENQTKLGEAREEVNTLIKILRLVVNKSVMPTRVSVYEGSNGAQKLVFSVRRGVALFRPKVAITDASGSSVGYLQSKMFSLGGAFRRAREGRLERLEFPVSQRRDRARRRHEEMGRLGQGTLHVRRQLHHQHPRRTERRD
jgi:hypothetical protein